MLAKAMVGAANRALEAAAKLVEDFGKEGITDSAIVASAVRLLKSTVADLLKRAERKEG